MVADNPNLKIPPSRKTKPCPACGHELILPVQFFDAVHKMKEHVDSFTPVLELDLIMQIERWAKSQLLYKFDKGYKIAISDLLDTLESLKKNKPTIIQLR